MHPVIILLPAAALILGPRAWVDHLMRRHDREDLDLPVTSSSFAREVLDRHQLQEVKVEVTDTGDHYDQQSKAVRIYRGRFNRKTLTAMTTAAHEVAHALQDASDYGPFVWRKHINKAAQITGETARPIISGAGHDAVYVNRVTPTGMIFIPCEDGLSHNELEHADMEDVIGGGNVLLQAMLQLANEA